MVNANNFINVADVNFNDLKNNIKTFIKTKPEFGDYDFDSTAMSLILDVLAYNTYQMNYYLNMAVNESFLDTSVIRSNAVSRAKELGYMPRSARAAKARVNVIFNPDDDPSEIIIPAYSKFIVTSDNIEYIFTTNEDETVVPYSGTYETNLDIYEGVVLNLKLVSEL